MSAVIDAIARHAAATPDAPALASGERIWTYSALSAQLAALTEGLRTRLAEAPGCVAIALENGPEWVLLDLALIALDRPSLPLPSFFTPKQAGRIVADAGAAWRISSDGVGAPIEVAGAEVRLERLNGDPARLPPGTAKVTYTSGSTGAPKGVCLAQAPMEAVAGSIVSAFGTGYAGVHVPVLPLGVLLENVAGLYAVLLGGGCYRVERPATLGLANPFRPDFAALGAALSELGATSVILAPELLRGLLAAAAEGLRWPTLKLAAVGGAKVAPGLVAAARAAGMPVYEGYGITEAGSVVAVNTPLADRPGSVGRPLAHADVAIASDGEILVGPSPFLGYVGAPRGSGPVATGDLGHLDEDGFLIVTGRKSNLLITSYGRNVSPEWPESELLAQPEVLHALVYGDGAPALSALIAPTSTAFERDMIAAAVARANAQLPDYAQIRDFRVTPPFSLEAGQLTSNGRLRRDVLLAAYVAPAEIGS